MISALVDERISRECERGLTKAGFRPIKLPRSRALAEAIASHPDTLLFYHEGRIITSADYCDEAAYVFSDIRELHPDIKISFTADSFGKKYPHDVPFNSIVLKNKLFAKADTLSEAIKSYAAEQCLCIVNTRQGYPACATLALNSNEVITADKGLAEIYKSEGIAVTLIESGDISLPPYDYGFIGGASGVFDGRVYFFGDYKKHKSASLIESAILRAGLTPISLSDEPLSDLGGIIFIK